MENLRWILIFAGVAILVLLYFSGRSPKSGRGQSRAGSRQGQSRSGQSRPGQSRRRAGAADPQHNQFAPQGGDDLDPLMGEQGHDQEFEYFGDPHMPSAGQLPDELGGFDDPDDFVRPASHMPDDTAGQGHRSADARPAAGGLSSLSKKIEAFSDRLTPGRRQRVAESEPVEILDAQWQDGVFNCQDG